MDTLTTKQREQFQREVEAYLELQKPIYHLAVDLGINAFKRELDIPGLTKSLKNKLIKAYKKRAWAEYHGKARDRGTFPTHPSRGKKMDIDSHEEESIINVKKK